MLVLLVLACTPLLDSWSGPMQCEHIGAMELSLKLTDSTTIQRSSFSTPTNAEESARARGNLDQTDDGAARPRETGTGTLDCSARENDLPCKETFDATLTRGTTFGDQAVELVFDNCNGQIGNADAADFDCGGLWNAHWDGADAITGIWADCSFELARDTE